MNSQAEIRSHSNYEEIALTIRKEGKIRVNGGYQRIIFTNGCFDLMHPGHLRVLQHCRELAGPLGAVVVGINDDQSCYRLKGPGRPILDQTARGLVLINMKNVDYVITFEEDTPLKLIEAIRPDVIVKGGDYDPLNVIGKNVAMVSISPLDDRWSTSKIVMKIKEET